MKQMLQPEPTSQPNEKRKNNTINAVAITLVLCSLVLMVLSQVIRAGVAAELRLAPLLMLPVGLVFFFIGIRAMDKERLPGWLEKTLSACASWLGVRPQQFLSLFFALLFSALTCVAAGFLYQMRMPVAAVLCWLLSIGLAFFGAWIKPQGAHKFNANLWISAVVIFGASFAIRSINTANIPIVLSGDEAASGLFSLKFLTGETDNLFITGWFSFPILFNFLESISIRIFGQTTEALRLMAAFGGALTVMLVYLFGREMFGNLAGWCAAIFLTGLHFHNHFSRIGLNNIWDAFFFMLVLGCIWLGWKRNLRLMWLIAGAGLGLAQYFYATGRMLFVVFPLWVVLAGIFDRQRLKQALPNLVAMLWTCLIVLLPLAWFYAHEVPEFLAPMNRVGIFGAWMTTTATQFGGSKLLVLLNQIRLGVLGYIEEPTRAWYEPGVPILRMIPGVFFLIGLAFTFLRPKDERGQLLWLWLAAITAAVAFSESAPAAQRYVAATPALALMIGFGLFQLAQLLIKWLPKRAILFNVFVLLISVFLAADDLRFYYFVYTPNSDFSGFNGQVAQRLANTLKDEPAGTELYFFGYPAMGYDSIASLPYLAPQINYVNVNEPWTQSEPPPASAGHVYFAFLPDHDADREAVEKEYPGGVWTEQMYTVDLPLYWLYEVDVR